MNVASRLPDDITDGGAAGAGMAGAAAGLAGAGAGIGALVGKAGKSALAGTTGPASASAKGTGGTVRPAGSALSAGCCCGGEGGAGGGDDCGDERFIVTSRSFWMALT